MSPLQTSKSRLLVEGSDDLHSIVHLMTRHGFRWDSDRAPYIDNTGGVPELLEAVPVTAKGAYERVGIVLDADVNLQSRWASVRDRLFAVGVDLPDAPAIDGTIVMGVGPGSRLGIWVMPDNNVNGRLEDFLGRLVPAGDPCCEFAKEATGRALKRGCRIADEQKSTIHAWLAWQQAPGLPFGTALRAKLFQHDSAEAN